MKTTGGSGEKNHIFSAALGFASYMHFGTVRAGCVLQRIYSLYSDVNFTYLYLLGSFVLLPENTDYKSDGRNMHGNRLPLSLVDENDKAH